MSTRDHEATRLALRNALTERDAAHQEVAALRRAIANVCIPAAVLDIYGGVTNADGVWPTDIADADAGIAALILAGIHERMAEETVPHLTDGEAARLADDDAETEALHQWEGETDG